MKLKMDNFGADGAASAVRCSAQLAVEGPLPLSPAPSSLTPSRVKTLKSASTEILVITNQRVTRGLFKRLDGVIAYPEKITNPRLFFNAERAVLEFLRALYDW